MDPNPSRVRFAGLWPTLCSRCSRLVRGLILILWILGLSFVALGSLKGTLADALLSKELSSEMVYSFPFGVTVNLRFPRQPVGGEGDNAQPCLSGDQLLSEYRAAQEDLPPIDALLDLVLPQWVIARGTPSGECTEQEQEEIRRSYRYLFSKVTERLRSFARNEGVDPKTASIDGTILPPEFQGAASAEVIKLPPEVQDWLSRERARIKQEAQARALVGTFLLLSALGAFGSLIFLIRDYITVDEERSIADYIFRPVLGIFLAVAMFVVDVLAHSVISTASILDIRYEPLYLLALGAGLLSEAAYNAVRHRVDAAIKRYGKDQGGESYTENE